MIAHVPVVMQHQGRLLTSVDAPSEREASMTVKLFSGEHDVNAPFLL